VYGLCAPRAAGTFEIASVRASKPERRLVQFKGSTIVRPRNRSPMPNCWSGRAALPATARDEFYHADLVGLARRWIPKAEPSVQERDPPNFGAGDVIELSRTEGALAPSVHTRNRPPRLTLQKSLWWSAGPKDAERKRNGESNEPGKRPC